MIILSIVNFISVLIQFIFDSQGFKIHSRGAEWIEKPWLVKMNTVLILQTSYLKRLMMSPRVLKEDFPLVQLIKLSKLLHC